MTRGPSGRGRPRPSARPRAHDARSGWKEVVGRHAAPLHWRRGEPSPRLARRDPPLRRAPCHAAIPWQPVRRRLPARAPHGASPRQPRSRGARRAAHLGLDPVPFFRPGGHGGCGHQRGQGSGERLRPGRNGAAGGQLARSPLGWRSGPGARGCGPPVTPSSSNASSGPAARRLRLVAQGSRLREGSGPGGRGGWVSSALGVVFGGLRPRRARGLLSTTGRRPADGPPARARTGAAHSMWSLAFALGSGLGTHGAAAANRAPTPAA